MTAAAAPLQSVLQEVIDTGMIAVALKDNVQVWKGSMVCIDSTGLALHASDSAGLYPVLGIADDNINNTLAGHVAGGWTPGLGATGPWLRVKVGIVARMNGTGFTQASCGLPALVVDDNTVQTAATTHSVAAGVITEYHSATEVGVFIPAPVAKLAAVSV